VFSLQLTCTVYPSLKCSHTTAYGISVCERMLIRSQTLIYVRGTLGIRSVRSEYADIRRCMFCYTQIPNYFLDMFKIYQRMRAYKIYVTYTLAIRMAYAGYARNTLDIRLILYLRWVHTMNGCSSVGQRLKSLTNEPKRRRNYVREKDIFHSHYECFISGAIQLLRTFPSVWPRLTAFASAWQRLPALYLFSISVGEPLPTQM